MTKKFMISLITLLSSISLVSVGFASWTIVSGNLTHNESVNGDISAENVMYTDYYVTIKKTTPLKYCAKGFVNSSTNKVDNYAILGIEITLNHLKEFKSNFSTAEEVIDSIGVDLSLSYDASGTYDKLFNTNLSGDVVFDQGTYSSSNKNYTPVITQKTKGNLSDSFIILNGLLNDGSIDSFTFKMDYKFTSEPVAYVKHNLVETFKKPNLFKFNVKLEGSKAGGK